MPDYKDDELMLKSIKSGKLDDGFKKLFEQRFGKEKRPCHFVIDTGKGGPTKSRIALLIAAIQYGNFEAVQFLINSGANLKTVGHGADEFSEELWNPLTLAVFLKRENIINLLVEKGADVTAGPGFLVANSLSSNLPSPFVPLIIAIDQGNLKLTSLLLEQKIKSSGHVLRIAINKAIDKQDELIVKCLLEHRAKITFGALEKAIDLKNLPIFKLLYQCKGNWAEDAEDVEFPLRRKVFSNDNHLEMAKFLIEQMTKEDKERNISALFKIAVKSNSFQIANYLLEQGADINFIYESGTLLHRAVNKKDIEAIKFLVDHGADYNIKNNDGKTALQLCDDSNDKSLEILKIFRARELSIMIPIFVQDNVSLNSDLSAHLFGKSTEEREHFDANLFRIVFDDFLELRTATQTPLMQQQIKQDKEVKKQEQEKINPKETVKSDAKESKKMEVHHGAITMFKSENKSDGKTGVIESANSKSPSKKS